VIAFISYPTFFARFPATRDFPWANLSLFVVAGILLIIGLKRAFGPGSLRRSKVAGVTVTLLSAVVLAFFLMLAFVVGRMLPASAGAPHVGQKAPEFTLADTSGKPVSLAELLSTPIEGKPPKGALLIFYRGYW
jgi:hypothetical protein